MLKLLKEYPLNDVLTKIPFSIEELTKIEDKYTYGTKSNPETHCTTFYTANDKFELYTGVLKRLVHKDILEIAQRANLNKLTFSFLDGREGLTTGFDILTCSRLDKGTEFEICINKPEAVRRWSGLHIFSSMLQLFVSLGFIFPTLFLFPIVISGQLRHGAEFFMLIFVPGSCFGVYYGYNIIKSFIDEYYVKRAFGVGFFSQIPYPDIKLNRQYLRYDGDKICWQDIYIVEHSIYQTIIYANNKRQYVIPKYNYISKYDNDILVQKIIEYATLVPAGPNLWGSI